MEIKTLMGFRLFLGMTEEEIKEMLAFLQAKEVRYQKGEVIFHAGQTTSQMGLVLEGSVTVESNDLWGNRTILNLIEPGFLFAETYALLQKEPMLVDAVANEDCCIMLLKVDGLNSMKSNQAAWAMKYTTNLLRISSYKNLLLSGRNFHTAPKTIRGRVMSYLNSVALQKHVNSFDIPYDRQQLADYLNLDRSALSKELGKMQRDGLIKVKKNHFTVIASFPFAEQMML